MSCQICVRFFSRNILAYMIHVDSIRGQSNTPHEFRKNRAPYRSDFACVGPWSATRGTMIVLAIDPTEIHLSDDLRRRVADLAEKTGKPWGEVLEQAIDSLTIEDLVTPVRAEFVKSGLSDDELGDFLEEEKHATRKERRAAGS